MSEKHCEFCKSILFDDDDVVVCPECGAPHHRECYRQLGHCAAEELHGAERCERDEAEDASAAEKVDEQVQECPSCGKKGPAGAIYCSHCGARYDGSHYSPHAHFVGTDVLGGISANDEIDGVKAEDMALYVRANTARYLPLFKRMSQHKSKVHWNWAAFLFPQAWLLLRKNYFAGFISVAVGLIATFMCGPLNLLLQNAQAAAPTNLDYAALVELQQAALQKADPLVIGLFLGGMLLSLIISIVVGRFGDRIYLGNATDRIKRIHANEEIEDKQQEILRVGGLNLWLAALVLMFTM